MNLPELLKIADDAMRCEWATEEWAQEHFGDDQEAKFVATFSPAKVASILKRLQEAEKIVSAAENLVKVKGRHHSEQAYNQLVAAINGGKE